MLVTMALTRIRTGRGGLGWRELVRVSFIGLLLFSGPVGHFPGMVPTSRGYSPEPGLLKCVQKPALSSIKASEFRTLCAEAHHTPSGSSIEYAEEVCQNWLYYGYYLFRYLAC